MSQVSEKINTWLFTVAAQKGAIQLAIAIIAMVGVDKLGGVDVPTAQKVIVGVIIGALNIVRNWLKVKQGVKLL